MTAIDDWYRSERNAIYGRAPQSGIRLTLGMVCWGGWYVDMFAKVCLPSLLAPANALALRDCGATLSVITTEADRGALTEALMAVGDHGIGAEIHIMPDAVLKASDRPFLALSAAQSLQVQRAVQNGQAFHPVMPDHCYNARYFPNLSALALKYRNIAHGGLNVAGDATKAALEKYTWQNSWIDVPARELATLGWNNTIMCSMNNNTPDTMPDEHFQVWRARDRVMLFNPYMNPVYIRPEVGRLLDQQQTCTGTIDCQVQPLFGTDFYVPGMLDDMCFLALGNQVQGDGPANNRTTIDKFLDRMWNEIGGRPERLVYYLQPTDMACEDDPTRIDAVQVMQAQRLLAHEAAKRKRIAA